MESQPATPDQSNARNGKESYPAQKHVTSLDHPSRNKQVASVLMADTIQSITPRFRESRARELKGLIERRGLSIVRKDEAHRHHVYES